MLYRSKYNLKVSRPQEILHYTKESRRESLIGRKKSTVLENYLPNSDLKDAYDWMKLLTCVPINRGPLVMGQNKR